MEYEIDSNSLKEAYETYGKNAVDSVISMVEVSDPDGVYTLYQDLGMDEEAEIVEALYFN